ncbi:MAG: hypothetical protein ACKPKO_62780, partial [Candidatus Fonsibacter sp.]
MSHNVPPPPPKAPIGAQPTTPQYPPKPITPPKRPPSKHIPPPPPTNTMVPTYQIYTPPHTRESSMVDLTRDDPEEQPQSFNPMRTSVQAFPKAVSASSSSSLFDGSPFTQRTTITRHGPPRAQPDYQDVSADPDVSSTILGSPPHTARTPSRASSRHSDTDRSMLPPAPPLLPDSSIDHPTEAPTESASSSGPSLDSMRRRSTREPPRSTWNPGDEVVDAQQEAAQRTMPKQRRDQKARQMRGQHPKQKQKQKR